MSVKASRLRFVVRLLPWQGQGRRCLNRWQVWDRIRRRQVGRFSRRDRAVRAAAFLSGCDLDAIYIKES